MRVGTSTVRCKGRARNEDHPHACGDKYVDNCHFIVRKRIIPMRVGTSVPLRERQFPVWDHPHACGDKLSVKLKLLSLPGSSPCVWGQVGYAPQSDGTLRIIPMRVGTSGPML